MGVSPATRTPALPHSRTPELSNSRTLALLILAFILVWFLSILPFFVSGQYRQPILPLLALLAAPFVERLLSGVLRGWFPGEEAAASCAAWRGRLALALQPGRANRPGEPRDQAAAAARRDASPYPAGSSDRGDRKRDAPSRPAHGLLLVALLFLTHLNLAGYAPSRVLPLFNAARSAELQGDLAEALARYREIASLPERLGGNTGEAPLRPNELAFCAMAALNTGTIEFNGGNPYRAERAYRQAIALEPGHAKARANLGAALLAQGRHAEAEEVLLEVLLNDPTRTFARLSLVQSLLAQGRRDAARLHLRILAADPAAVAGLKQMRTQFPDLGL